MNRKFCISATDVSVECIVNTTAYMYIFTNQIYKMYHVFMGNLCLEEKWPQIGTLFINDIEIE